MYNIGVTVYCTSLSLTHTHYQPQTCIFVCLRTHNAYTQCNTIHHPAMTILIRTLGLMYTLKHTLGCIWLIHTTHTVKSADASLFVCLRTHNAYTQCHTRHHPAMTTLIRTLGLMYTLIHTLGFIWLIHTTHTVKSADASTPSAWKRQRQSGCGSADTTDDSLIRSEQGGEGSSDISSPRGD